MALRSSPAGVSNGSKRLLPVAIAVTDKCMLFEVGRWFPIQQCQEIVAARKNIVDDQVPVSDERYEAVC